MPLYGCRRFEAADSPRWRKRSYSMANPHARRRQGGEFRDVERFEVAIRPQIAPRDRKIAVLAARQHGVVAHRQLMALGLSASAIQRMVSAGRLHPIHRGVYAVGHLALGYLGRW